MGDCMWLPVAMLIVSDVLDFASLLKWQPYGRVCVFLWKITVASHPAQTWTIFGDIWSISPPARPRSSRSIALRGPNFTSMVLVEQQFLLFDEFQPWDLFSIVSMISLLRSVEGRVLRTLRLPVMTWWNSCRIKFDIIRIAKLGRHRTNMN